MRGIQGQSLLQSRRTGVGISIVIGGNGVVNVVLHIFGLCIGEFFEKRARPGIAAGQK